jgi:hypothetical protein
MRSARPISWNLGHFTLTWSKFVCITVIPDRTEEEIFEGRCELALDPAIIIQYLNAVSAIAITVGVLFVVFQLRQNAKLIEASNKQIQAANRQVEVGLQQNKQTVILSTIDRFTDESFIRKRKKIRDVIRKYREDRWKDFFESVDDFEVRGFLNLYDATGYLVKNGILDIGLISDGMGYLLMYDWESVEPAMEFYELTWNRNAFPNFRWLRNAIANKLKRDSHDFKKEGGELKGAIPTGAESLESVKESS